MAGKKLSKSMRIKELSNEWKLVRNLKIEIMRLSIECENMIEDYSGDSYKAFLDGRVDSYRHCFRLLTQLEDKLR